MFRVGLAAGIVVIAGSGEMVGAVSVLMYVHSVEIAGIGDRLIGKTENLRFHQDSAIGGVVEFHQAAESGSLSTALDPRLCLGTIVFKKLGEGESRCR